MRRTESARSDFDIHDAVVAFGLVLVAIGFVMVNPWLLLVLLGALIAAAGYGRG